MLHTMLEEWKTRLAKVKEDAHAQEDANQSPHGEEGPDRRASVALPQVEYHELHPGGGPRQGAYDHLNFGGLQTAMQCNSVIVKFHSTLSAGGKTERPRGQGRPAGQCAYGGVGQQDASEFAGHLLQHARPGSFTGQWQSRLLHDAFSSRRLEITDGLLFRAPIYMDVMKVGYPSASQNGDGWPTYFDPAEAPC